ncbi:MFS transporter [Kutzneria viridogrisea]|uniref:MFS family permease n=1 Tax=Kutzneria viridogrisea TaxID=47990 RepID=A0ABR6BEJ3_9PSEU|nr:MFS family permease [Kutzneria viridogrisea]
MARPSLLAHADFRRLWAGDTVSQFGVFIGQFAIPTLAITLLAATPFEVGALSAAETCGFLLVGLPAGVWVDRLRRRPLMLRADLARGALLATIPLAWALGVLTVAQLLVTALLVGVLTVFFDVAYQSYLPALVSRDQLADGNAKLQASQSTAQVTGPAIAGWLVQVVGAANAVLATALGFFASAAALWRIRTVEPEPDRTQRRGMRVEIAEGLRFVLHHRVLRAITGCTATANLFGGVNNAVLMVFLVRELGVVPGLAGALLAMGGIGGVLGALHASWWARRVGQARSIWLVQLVFSPMMLLLPLAGNDWRLAFFALAEGAVGYSAVVYNVAQVSFRQGVCPDHLLGRMNASIRFIVWGTLPLGGLLGGALAEWVGARGALWVGAAGGLLAVLWVLASPLRTLRDLPTEQPRPTSAR